MGRKKYKWDNFCGGNGYFTGNMFRDISGYWRCWRRNYFMGCRRPFFLFRIIAFGSLIGILIVSIIGIPVALIVTLITLGYLLFRC